MGDTGLELTRFSAGNTHVSKSGGIKNGIKVASSGDSTPMAKPTDPEFAAVVAAWSSLPIAIRVGVLALVKAGQVST